jgi:hypothetical protein
VAKKFFYVSAGLFLLAVSYQFGARSAGAQAPGNPVVSLSAVYFAQPLMWAVTSNGDVYADNGSQGLTWVRRGNVFGNSPTASQSATWGQVKSTYRK